MNSWNLLFVFASLLQPGHCTDPCVSYQELSDPWRNIGFFSTAFPGYPHCDNGLAGQWWRFTGIGGDVITENCVPEFHSGGYCAAYLGFPHPTLGEGIKTGSSFCMWNGNCTLLSYSDIQVLACTGGYYVYNLPNTDCPITFAIMHKVCNETVCGPRSQCINGACICASGYTANNTYLPTPESFGCEDIDECATDPGICGPEANCQNTVGSYTCTCYVGFLVSPAGSMPSATNPCQDIDECTQNPAICGDNTGCTNTIGSYQCYCLLGFLPSPGFQWQFGTTVCITLAGVQGETDSPSTQMNAQKNILNNIQQNLMSTSNISLPVMAVSNILEMAVNISGNIASNNVDNGQTAEVGSVLLTISEKLVSTLVENTSNWYNKTIKTSTAEIFLQGIGPGTAPNMSDVNMLMVKDNAMSINLSAIAENNNGSAAVMFMSVNGMDKLLSVKYFSSENATQINSDVITATVLDINTTSLPEPVNFTLRHKEGTPENGLMTCVYWEANVMRWSTEGCTASTSDENTTICTCTHLSTFAVILQTDKNPPKDDPILQWVNLICMCIGLTFLGLAALTFICCTWNPKVNNTARLHLSLTLFLAYLLFLVGLDRTQNALVCSIIAGLLHFLFLSSFVWMFLETVQLFMLVRGLTKVQVIQKEGLRKRYLLVIGYGTPLLIVAISAGVVPSGYGSATKCWLNTERGFIWSFMGPVCVILSVNCIVFCVILWILQPTLANMKSGMSQAKEMRLIVFKIVAQSIILGCAWILGFFQSSTLLQYLFVIVNSQQGTFIFIVHCLFNKEVREEYVVWFTRLCKLEKPNESRRPSVRGHSVEAESSVSG